MELNYKAMFEALSERVNALLKADEEYFALLSVVNDKAPFATVLGKNLVKLPKSDQLKYLRCVSAAFLIAEELCQKYNLPVEEETT